ncbi:amidohydrolase family protein [Amycolatopsis acidiphila]|uniref:amidohydrolase family protein n=1 Tax=Amycolatopsis acidiphila TaxID=715473 RepID=UPI001989B661|nr:amidohydrolase family protein [Amycolatopsis acidiphila]UIJ63449.1 amidohydrolase family protein [Amycolatopsis acidiphila]GHG99083.1 hypothetical protein GCM10017788_79470 [Amycolatopsis acidiphila]
MLDHLGLPGSSAGAEHTVLDLARREHVWIKASAPYRSPTTAATTMLGRILAEAGPHRLLWGSDWPWTRHEHGRTYAACLTWLRERVDDQTFHAAVDHNPARLLHWSPTVAAPASPGAERVSGTREVRLDAGKGAKLRPPGRALPGGQRVGARRGGGT